MELIVSAETDFYLEQGLKLAAQISRLPLLVPNSSLGASYVLFEKF